MKISKELAEKFLSDVQESNCFWVNNGPILRNLDDLATALEYIDDVTYSHHVNKEKNDFSNWIKDIIGDELLAKEISKSRSKDFALKKVEERVFLLKKVAKR